MGKKGREIVKLSIPQLLNTLNSLYADEWLFHYYYSLAANVATGLYSPAIIEMCKKASAGELGHANKLAERIVQLGGEPLRDVKQLVAKSKAPPFKMPKSTSDMAGLIRAILELERHAIASYQDLLDETRMKDAVTHEMAEELLEEEVAEEEEWENLLGE